MLSNNMDSSLTLSAVIEKIESKEEMTLTQASMKAALFPAHALSNEEIKPGELLCGIYRVLDKLETGGMGIILKVNHENWEKELAVKRPKPQYFAEAGAGRRKAFIAECENWINLGLHPHIVACYYVREVSGVPSIFSEWMDGGSLADRICDGSLYYGTNADAHARILDLAIQSARGLKYAHENGLLHQDVKPANLLLSKDWDLKVADFGIAKAKEHLRDGQSAIYGYSLGYCPKEQAEGAEPEAWMDVYAWGVTLLEMYAGRRFWNTGAEAFQDLFVRYGAAEPAAAWAIIPPQKLISEFERYFGKSSESSINPGAGKPTFEGMEALLIEIYEETTGMKYPRPALRTALDTADSLNNRALSFYDLGRTDIAERYWQESVRLNPMHKDSCLNYGLYLWRNGKCSDQDVWERLLYFADLSERYHDEAGMREFYRIRESFWKECGCESLAGYGERIDVRDKLSAAAVTPKETPPGIDAPYLFALEDRNRGGRYAGMVLRIHEKDSGRIIRTIDVEPVDHEFGPDGQPRGIYPELMADYVGGKLYFAITSMSGKIYAADYDMPAPPETPWRMGYHAASPVSFKERAAQDQAREACEQAFREALAREDRTGMLSAYGKILSLPLTEGHDAPVEMSRAIMERIQLPGIYDIVAPGTEMFIGRNRIWGYEEGEPRPAEVYGMFPVPPEEAEEQSLSGRRRKKPPVLIPRLIDAVRSNGRHIARVLAVSSLGDSLVLELRDGAEEQGTSGVICENEASADDYYIVWALRNGRRMTELLHGIGDNPFKAAALDKDNILGPFRVYLWRPYTRDIRYFEEDYWNNGDEIAFRRMHLPFPLPEELKEDPDDFEEVFVLDEERREWEAARAARDPQPLIKSLMISENEDKLIVVLVKKETWGDDEKLYLYRKDEEVWELVFYGEAPERTYVSKDLSFVLNGIAVKTSDPLWEWTLWSTERPENEWGPHKLFQYTPNRKPLWYMKEFMPESRIRSLSDDLCSLLDENGKPVYAVCWRFRS